MNRATSIISSIAFILVFCICISGADKAAAASPSAKWTITLGASGIDTAFVIGVDSAGNMYYAGYFNGTFDFNPGSGTDNHTSNGLRDAFISKFDSSGNYLWTKTWGGSGDDTANGLAVDASGNAVVSGRFQQTVDIDPGAATDNRISNAGAANNIFVSKFDTNGNLLWAKTWGGTTGCEAYGCVMDSDGNVYVDGDFSCPTIDFDPTGAHDYHTLNGFFDAFICKFDLNGNFKWAKTWGGAKYDDCCCITLDGKGNLYAGGMFASMPCDFDPGIGVDNHSAHGADIFPGYIDVFLCKYDLDGNFIWARTWGGSGEDCGEAVSADSLGNVYVTGYYSDTVNFDPEIGTDNHTSNGLYDVFVSKISPAGNLIWAKTFGGSGNEAGTNIRLDGTNNAIITGYYSDIVDFDPGAGTDNHNSTALRDAFVSKLKANGDFSWAETWGGSGDDNAYGLGLDGSDSIYVTGGFQNTVDFGFGSGTDNHTSNGLADIFLINFIGATSSVSDWRLYQ